MSMTYKPVLDIEGTMKDTIDAFYKKGAAQIYGLGGSQKSFMYSQAMLQETQRPTLIVTHDKAHKDMWERDIQCLLPEVQVLSYPIVDRALSQWTAKSLDTQAKRMEALGNLALGKPVIVLATVEEASQFVGAPSSVLDHMITLQVEQDIDQQYLLEKLVQIGYERVDQVEYRGHFSVRGDIVDIFPIQSESPYRFEFFGDTIDTMRQFNVDTQRSMGETEECMVLPIHANSDEEGYSILSYLDQGLLILDEPKRLEEALGKVHKEDATNEELYMLWKDWKASSKAHTTILFSMMQRSAGWGKVQTIGMMGKSIASYERQIPMLMDDIKFNASLKRQIVLVLHNQQRREAIENALLENKISYVHREHWEWTAPAVLIVDGILSEGFELPHSNLTVITEGNIFGFQKKKIGKKVEKGQEIKYFTDISVGDYVVHSIHGIGKYRGLKTIETEGIHRDYIEIDYAGTDRLFLPADHLDQLQKYIGNEGVTPKLHKMGGKEWIKTKTKAQKSIDDLADTLVELYAKRELIEGYAFLPDQPWQREFEDQFPYEETDDQLQAIQEIKESMESPRPMDRLLCGDVGFGKTEVAMRAMFKAVMSGKQVAMLVPTTVLSEQHFKTFMYRFSQFGVRVEVLNRFRSAKEKKDIIKAVQDGQVDILIGTHALLSKQIQFKKLGLLVVDEEQRFGVAQKEKWKQWATNIDILTLSATPIPRTLHMSLVGVREMSVIHTPPMERLPVQTYVVEFDMQVVTEAIRRELQRGGQVYFVYNKVQSITHMEEQLQRAMPDLRIAVAHGQMAGTMMEHVMQDFTEGQYDVLLCTSIIETGLDIPNANTIIIYDADHLGLSQLYQMRGRVGRSSQRAYAYFMYRPDKVLNESAEKRLKAIQEFTELGAGFKLAMRDMEIRGAGNLLGAQQHGNIAAVGFAMYAAMLEEAIAKVQKKDMPERPLPAPVVDVGIDAFIDSAYIHDEARKISVYQRLLQIDTKAGLDDFVDELIDRFGSPTKPVERLIKLASIKERARALGMKSIIRKDGNILLTWQDESKMEDWDMGAISETIWKHMKHRGSNPTVWAYTLQTGDVIRQVEQVMSEFERKLPKEG
ncbi:MULTISPECIES: transcription-repair coupling factor [unclassified Veillonella]|uniref:transcription-repair coupling factor n=1 Tax=unclassified Veillonella TaxID=2630086 RepID=UPI000F8E918E|nr:MULTISPECIES: transcription-repair coupling factor [unclassified Veillonella]